MKEGDVIAPLLTIIYLCHAASVIAQRTEALAKKGQRDSALEGLIGAVEGIKVQSEALLKELEA